MAVIAIHGGAGLIKKELYSDNQIEEYQKELSRIVELGTRLLVKGETSINVVAAVVSELEDCPLFNAGKGSVFSAEGAIEMDASIMCGKTLACAGVTNITSIRNPILAAKLVMQQTSHRLIAGEGVHQLAQTYGLTMADKEYFFTKHRYDQFLKAKEQGIQSLDHGNDSNTVGAVAIDQQGNLAAATSTGGMNNKLKGRISDSSMIGAGNYANNQTLAISGTGTGDEFIRHVACFDVHAQMLYGNIAIQEALGNTLNKIKASGGQGGFIAIDKNGNIFMPFNSRGMFRASYKDGKQRIEIW